LCVPVAAKLSLGLRKPHFRVPNPKIREFDGEVCNGRSGSGLGGKRCGDCGRELRLLGRGGGGFSNPKRKERKNVAWSWSRRQFANLKTKQTKRQRAIKPVELLLITRKCGEIRGGAERRNT
jgi:hypothetical protein